MAGLTSKVSPLLTKSAGSVTAATAQIRSMKEFRGDTVAGAMDDLQDQINQIVRAATQNQSLLNLVVTSKLGVLIGWVGTQIVNSVVYMGAWFREMRIGGTSAADARIVADANGDVNINGATLTLDAGGVLTTIQNNAGPDGTTLSLTSLDETIAHGQFTSVNPFAFQSWAWDPVLLQYSPAATLRTAGGAGRLNIGNVAGTISATLATGGTGAPFLSLFRVLEVLLSPSVGLSFAGTVAISPTRDGNFVNLAISGNFTGTHAQNVGTGDSPTFAAVAAGSVSANGFTASGSPGINASDTRVTGVSSTSASFLTSVSVSTNTISYTPGASTATFVDGVGSSSGTALDSISAPTSPSGYTKGIRTS